MFYKLYYLKDLRGRIIYAGYTKRPQEREQEHRREHEQIIKFEVVDEVFTEADARRWEAQQESRGIPIRRRDQWWRSSYE